MARFHAFFKKWLTNSPRTKPAVTAVKVGVFQLENRTTPATANLVEGTLTINFTAANEAVTFNTTATDAVLTGDGFNVTGEKFELAKVNRVVLNDTVNLGGQQITFTTFTGKTLTLANGLKSTGVDTVLATVASITVTGDAGIDIAAPSRIEFLNSTITTGAGGLRLVGNGEGFTNVFNAVAASVSLIGGTVTTTGNGSVNLQGTALGTSVPVGQTDISRSAIGVLVNSDITTSGGDITLNGTTTAVPDGFVSTDRFNGVILTGKLLPGGNGSVFITGKVGAGTTADRQHGVSINSAAVVSVTGTGKVEINGTAGGGSGSGGVVFSASIGSTAGTITSTSGDVSIVGIGSVSTKDKANHGVIIANSVINATGGANISIRGTSGEGTSENTGITIENGKISAVDGSINLNGTSTATGTGNSNHGVLLASPQILVSGAGSVNAAGTGGGGKASVGVATSNSKVTTTTGGINLTGVGGAGTAQSIGVVLRGLLESKSGAVNVTGTGSGNVAEPDNFGVRIERGTIDGQAITTDSGSITINAKGQSGSTGVSFNTGTLKTTSGAIRLNTDGFNNKNDSTGEILGIIQAPSGSVGIGPLTPGTKVVLGGDDVLTGSPLTLGLSNDELQRLIRNNTREVATDSFTLVSDLVFGSAAGGDILDKSRLQFLLDDLTGKSVTFQTAGFLRFGEDYRQQVNIGPVFGETKTPPPPVPLKVQGGLDVSNVLLSVSSSAPPGTAFVLFENDRAETVRGSYTNTPTASDPFRLNYAGGDGNDVVLTFQSPDTPALPAGPILNPADNGNIAPSISPLPVNARTRVLTPFVFTVQVSDPETPAQDLVLTTPRRNFFTVDIATPPSRPSERVVTITPELETVTSFIFTLTDASGARSESTLNLNVDGVAAEPPIVPPTTPPTAPPVVPPAPPATFTVANLNDSGVGSLRQAVLNAEASPGANIVTFEAGLAGTITLTSGEVTVTDTLNIQGNGAVTISGNNASRIITARMSTGETLRVANLTFAGGNAEEGGAIFAGAESITGNVDGTYHFENLVFSGNQATLNGGAILVDSDAVVTILNSTFENNSSGGTGGALVVFASAKATIVNSTFVGNSTVGQGGALAALNAQLLSIANSTLSANRSGEDGGAIYITNGTSARIDNSTIVLNQAGTSGVGNGGGIGVIGAFPADSIDVHSVILAGNTHNGGATNDLFRSGSAVLNVSNSLVQTDPTAMLNGTSLGNLFGIDPLLGALADNGGPTRTHLPDAGSPVADVGANRSALTTDQRGGLRQAGTGVDIGAVELDATPPTIPPVVPPVVPPIMPPVVFNGPSVITATAERGSSTVNIYNADGSLRLSVNPFGDIATAIRTTTGDFNNDGVEDLVVGTGAGVSPRVSVFDGKTHQELFTFEPYESTFRGGVFVATGDQNNDGFADLIVTPDVGGGPRVRVVRFTASGGTPTVDFFGIDDPNFRGGARAAMGDVDGDGQSDLIVAAGNGGGPRIAVYNGSQLGGNGGPKLIGDFFAFEQSLRNGAYVTAGDVNGDGRNDIVLGGGPGGGPRVFVIDGRSLATNGSTNLVPVASFFVGNANDRDGVRVVVKDLDGDRFADIVAGTNTRLTAFTGVSTLTSSQPAMTFDFTVFPELGESVFVG